MTTVTDAEGRRIDKIKARLSTVIGELSEKNLVDTVNAVQELFNAFFHYQIPGYQELREKYGRAKPGDMARRILNTLSVLDSATGKSPVQKLAVYSGNASKELDDFTRDMENIEKSAEKERAAAEKVKENFKLDSQLETISKSAKAALSKLSERLENMEVREC